MSGGIKAGSCETISGIEIDKACFSVVAETQDRFSVRAGNCHAIPDNVGYVLPGRLLQQVRGSESGLAPPPEKLLS